MIYIDSIRIENKEKSTLYFDVVLNNRPKRVFFEVENQYSQYLCNERCDAIVIGLLNYAMRYRHNIKSVVPITEELLYNINTYLIPSLTRYDKKMHKIEIIAPTISEPIKTAGAVGTGLSCGVDSFHAITNHYNSKYKSMNLTHLCIHSVGSFHNGYAQYGVQKAKAEVYERAEKVAQELGLPIVKSNSNIKEQFEIYFEHSHTYYSMFAVYCLQKLWGVYYYGSSGRDFQEFSIVNNSTKSSAMYELLSLPCFSTHTLHLYTEGGAKNRLEKTIAIADNPVVQRHLHVCCTEGKNCGWCLKCKRTLLTLDILGKLDDFREVFDVDYYRENKDVYLNWLYINNQCDDEMLEPIYQALKKEIGFGIRFRYWYMRYFKRLFSISEQGKRVVTYFLFIKISFKNKNYRQLEAELKQEDI